VPGIGTFSSRRAVVDPRSVRSLSLPSCAVTNASYDGTVTDSARERASVATLFCPEMCLISVM
jgi:hypothetical protein